jgi:hypothetical protein
MLLAFAFSSVFIISYMVTGTWGRLLGRHMALYFCILANMVHLPYILASNPTVKVIMSEVLLT